VKKARHSGEYHNMVMLISSWTLRASFSMLRKVCFCIRTTVCKLNSLVTYRISNIKYCLLYYYDETNCLCTAHNDICFWECL